MLKKTIKIVAFIICVSLIMTFVVKILRFKSSDGIDQMHAFYKNPENTVDVLFLGSSHMYTNVNTGILWSEYGISAYDLGAAEQPFWNTYFCLKEALKTQKPKVIVLEIFSATFHSAEFQTERWTIDNLYGMNFNLNFVEAVNKSIKEGWYADYLNRFARYHSRYTMITEDDFKYDSGMENFKGFVPKFGTNPQEKTNVHHVSEATFSNEKMGDYLMKTINLAGEEDIPVILVCAPYATNEGSQEIFNAIYQYADKKEVPYIDCNVRYDELGIDFSQDFVDWSHLNEKGNVKYTNYLGNYLDENYELPDHRGDERYASWDRNAELLEHELIAYQLVQTADFSTYLDQINRDDYIVMMSARNMGNDFQLSEEALQKLAGIGMDTEMVNQYGNIVLYNGVEKFSNNELNYQWYMEDGTSDFCMEREYVESVSGKYEETMHDASRMIVDGVNYFQDGYKLNIVVYDTVLNRVVDAVGIKVREETSIIRGN